MAVCKMTPEQEQALLNAQKRLALQNAQSRLETPERDSMIGEIRPEFLKSRAKMAPFTVPSLIAAAGETFYVDPAIAAFKGESPDFTGSKFMQNFEKYLEGVSQIVGADHTMEPASEAERFVGGAVTAVADPLSYPGAPFKALSLLGRAGGQAVLGGTSEVTAEYGARMEQQMTGEDTGIGRLIGGLAPAIGSIPTAATAHGVFDTTHDTFKRVSSSRSMQKGIPSAQKDMLRKIANEQGIVNIDAILDEFNRIGHRISKKDVPLMVAMSDNSVVARQMQNLVKTDPVFREKVTSELHRLKGMVEDYSSRVFGQRYPDIGTPSELVQKMNKSLAPIRKRIDNLDNQIESLVEKVSPTMSKEARGRKISNLVDQRKTAIRQEMSPQYNQLVEDAMTAGAVLPAESTKQIYQFVKQNNIRDLFGKGTALDSKIMKYLSPKKSVQTVRPSATDPTTGQVTPAVTRNVSVYPTLDFDQMDSLKRAINSIKRQPLGADGARLIGQLDSVVKEARKNIPGDFNQRLIDLDVEYHKRLGIPFSEQGIVEIGVKKYYEEVAPVLTKNRSALKDFLDVSGEEGVEIARNAILSEVYDTAVTNGSLNPKALSRYMKKKSEVIGEIPGMRQELTEIAVDHGKLMLKRDRLDRAYKQQQNQIGKHFLSQSSDIAGVDYNQMLREVFSKKERLDSLMSDISKLDNATAKSVRHALRSELVEYANTQPQGAFDFLTDIRNRAVVGRIMGVGYQQAAKDVARMSDALRRADPSRIAMALEKDAAGTVLGVDVPYIMSQVRDRIASVFQKGIRVGSKAYDASRTGRFDESMKELFTDPESMMKLKKVADAQLKYDTGVGRASAEFIRSAVNAFGDVMPAYVYTGLKPTIEEDARNARSINQ